MRVKAKLLQDWSPVHPVQFMQMFMGKAAAKGALPWTGLGRDEEAVSFFEGTQCLFPPPSGSHLENPRLGSSRPYFLQDLPGQTGSHPQPASLSKRGIAKGAALAKGSEKGQTAVRKAYFGEPQNGLAWSEVCVHLEENPSLRVQNGLVWSEVFVSPLRKEKRILALPLGAAPAAAKVWSRACGFEACQVRCRRRCWPR